MPIPDVCPFRLYSVPIFIIPFFPFFVFLLEFSRVQFPILRPSCSRARLLQLGPGNDSIQFMFRYIEVSMTTHFEATVNQKRKEGDRETYIKNASVAEARHTWRKKWNDFLGQRETAPTLPKQIKWTKHSNERPLQSFCFFSCLIVERCCGVSAMKKCPSKYTDK